MKKIIFLLLLVSLSVAISGCRFLANQSGQNVPILNKKELTDQEFIEVALEAERRFYRVVYSGNPEKLKAYQIQPVATEIKTLQDVAAVMNPYWQNIIIRRLWKIGSKAMPDLPFGFYNDDFLDLGLLDAKNIRVVRRSRTAVLVTGDVSMPENSLVEAYTYSPEIILKWTASGWKAWNGLGN